MSNNYTHSGTSVFANLLINNILTFLARLLHHILCKNVKKQLFMKRITYMLLLVSATVTVSAQQVWNMSECMQYAVEHSTAVELQLVEARQAKIDYRAAALSFLPSLNAGVSAQYSWGRNIDPETNTYNNVTTFNNYYQLYASLPVFDGFRTLNEFKQARLARRNSQTALQKARDAKAIEVMQSYVDAVYAQQSIRLATEKLAESRRVLHKTQRMFDLGGKSRPDVAAAEAQVAEDDYNLTHQQNEARRTLLALKSAMNFPVSDALELDTTVASPAPLASVEDPETLYETFSLTSPEVLAAANTVKSSRYDYLISRASLLPTLTLNGGIATNYYKNLTQGSTAESFSQQFKNNSGEYLTLSLSIPLFNVSDWKSAKRAKSDWQTAQIQLEETQRKLHDDIHQAVMDRDGYAKEIMQMEHKVSSDSLAHHLNYRKYEEGMLSNFELRESANTLLESRITLLQMRLLFAMKQRLVDYYKGESLYIIKN